MKDSSNARRWPDHDPVNSMPAVPLPTAADVPRAVRERYDEVDEVSDDAAAVLAAANEALRAAVDLARPHSTAGKCLTVSATLNVAVEHPGRAGWAADRLRRLAHEWEQAES